MAVAQWGVVAEAPTVTRKESVCSRGGKQSS